jgi:signal transduction histidine kinase
VVRGGSILTRILIGLAVVIACFGAVAGWSAWQHHRTVRVLRLVNRGYLRLTLEIRDLHAMQEHFGPQLDWIAEGGDPHQPLGWLRQARRFRAESLRRAIDLAEGAGTPDLPLLEVRFLAATVEALQGVQGVLAGNDERYVALEIALADRDLAHAEALADDASAVERDAKTRLWRLQRATRQKITDLAEQAERSEKWTLRAIVLLGTAALLVGLVVVALTHRLLSPLARLQRGAEAAAAGDLTLRLRMERPDEIGALAGAFDRMLEALQARDAKLRDQAEELVRSERLAAIGKMASHITHEVRNPLSSIGLNVELLEEEVAGLGDGASTKEARALLGAIAKEVDRLGALTTDYLRLARVPQPSRESVDVGAVVQSVVDFCARDLAESRVQVSVAVADDVGRVALDEAQMRQVLLNLVRNAKEAMPSGGAVRIEVVRIGDAVEIAVQDAGPGVAREDAARIFEPFHTSKAQGTGLGLPLARQLVRGHGGDIFVEAGPRGGARFVIRLPASPAEREPDRAEVRP